MLTNDVHRVQPWLGKLPPASGWRLCFNTAFQPREVKASFAAYQALFAEFKVEHPHAIHLGRREFDYALRHNQVGKAVVEIGASRLALPLFGPVIADPGLSEGYYRRIERSRSVRILHFFHLPDFLSHPATSPQGLLQHLATFADSNTLFSYAEPNAAHAQGQRLRAIAQAAGLQVETPERLGVEWFFAGKLTLKHGHSGAASRTLREAYETMLDGAAPIGGGDSAAYFKTALDRSESKQWWQVYKQSFGKIEKDHPSRQKLSPQQFFRLMQRPDVFKAVVYDRSGDPVAMCVLGDFIALGGEMNEPFFQRRFPAAMEARQVLCFRGLFSYTNSSSPRRTQPLIHLLTNIGERVGGDWLITFSTRDQTRRVVPYLTQKTIASTQKARLSLDEIGRLSFDVFRIH